MKQTKRFWLVLLTRPWQVLRFMLALIRAWFYDRYLGIETGGQNHAPEEDISIFGDMRGYQPTFYGTLEQIAKNLRLTPDDVFVDLGCGKGRTVLFMATRGLKKAIGVDLNKELLAIAQKNTRTIKIKTAPVEWVCSDAAEYDLRQATVVYIYDAFGSKTVEKALHNLKQSLLIKPRTVRIIYYEPKNAHLLDQQNWLYRETPIWKKNCPVWRTTPVRSTT